MTDARARVTSLDLDDDTVALETWALSRAAYQVEADLLGLADSAATQERIAQLRRLELRWLGAYADGELVGVLGYRELGAGLELRRLAVDPRRFRTGVASGLLAALPPAPAVSVRASVGNTPALALYARHGFVPCGESILESGVRIKYLIRRSAARQASRPRG
jgi:GNAT superfamily N-acetyltransferase